MSRLRVAGLLFAQMLLLSVMIAPIASARRQEQATATPTASPPPRFASYNASFPPPPGWSGHVFSLSQNYPAQPPAPETHLWDAIDFHQQPLDYLKSVLGYALEGNTAIDFEVQNNPVRTWYHAPWLDTGCFGREFVHGLTRERSSRARELHPNQTSFVDNWAVGFYNPPGGYTLGQVWNTPSGVPDPTKAVFPVGTVAFKLLFTTALTTEVPFLAGAFEWDANIYPRSGANPCIPNRPPPARQNQTVRLLQVDVAVRDDRAAGTGWVFGTFIYDAAAPGATPWDRLVPVGAMWGNDPTVKADMNRLGAFLNPSLAETSINPLLVTTTPTATQALVMHLGLGGRLNGPIDNSVSSCMSCHGRASYPGQTLIPSGATQLNYSEANFAEYFANLLHGAGPLPAAQGQGVYLDYSLQLAAGLEAFCRLNDCTGISLATPVPSPTAVALRSSTPVTATTSPEATPTDMLPLPTPAAAAVRAAAMSVPNISREGNPTLVDQLASPETAAQLPNTGATAHGWFVLAILALTIGIIGLLLRQGALASAGKRKR